VTSEHARPDQSQIDIVFALIEARYGRSFTEDERARVRDDLAATFEWTASLRALRLDNGDEPMPLFTVEACGEGR
jgi:hypothetical protein